MLLTASYVVKNAPADMLLVSMCFDRGGGTHMKGLWRILRSTRLDRVP